MPTWRVAGIGGPKAWLLLSTDTDELEVLAAIEEAAVRNGIELVQITDGMGRRDVAVRSDLGSLAMTAGSAELERIRVLLLKHVGNLPAEDELRVAVEYWLPRKKGDAAA